MSPLEKEPGCGVQGDPAPASGVPPHESPGPFSGELTAPPVTSQSLRKQNEREPNFALEKAAKIKQFEDEILEDALGVVSAAISFGDITGPEHDEDDIPQRWLDRCDGNREEAAKRMRIAKSAWLPKNVSPTALDMSTKISSSIIKARSVEKGGPRVLNISFVNLSAPIPTFDVIDVDSE